MDFKNYQMPYTTAPQFSKKVAYFSMEFAIDQALKIYSGGLGFLAGSHMRSAYTLKQDLIGIGILWKYGYYDQSRNKDQTLLPAWTEKIYHFLEDTGITFQIMIHQSPVWVKAWYLAPETFNTAPIFLLSTEVEENDYLAKTICHQLYDSNPATKIAQYILLGKGGATLLDHLNAQRETYHLNEAHGLPAAFHLLEKYNGNLAKVKEKLVFTTHTPEEAGNEKHDLNLCYEMSYFSNIPLEMVKQMEGGVEGIFNHSLCALKMAKVANGVSRLHGDVSREMWGKYDNICTIKSITNAQDPLYWADNVLQKAIAEGNDQAFDDRKSCLKKNLFLEVANQTGKIFSEKVLTIVWARRFAEYKRADLLLRDYQRFLSFLKDKKYPVQIIWAGKPYPQDQNAIATFNLLINESKKHPNVAVLTGYELALSKLLKQGADLWLNNPRVPREASGTSGMSAAMNGAINLSTDDGWIPEFAVNGENAFVVPKVDQKKSILEQDLEDLDHLYTVLENEILPMYYDSPEKWRTIQKKALLQVIQDFSSDRMAAEYYSLYN